MIPFRLVLAILVLAFTGGWGATWLHDDPEHARPPKVERPTAGVKVGTPLPVGDSPDPLAAASATAEAFYAEQARLEQERIAAYLAALAEEAARLEAERQARARQPSPPAPRSTGGTVGSCTGFAIPDYIIQRESGGNPNAYNPSGAYGCAQTLLSHYSAGHTCAGLDPYTIDGQRECVNRLSNGGTNLSPWAQTR